MRTKDESEWIKIPNHHTPLVSKELFEKANASIKRFKIPKRKQHSYPLRGKVFAAPANMLCTVPMRLFIAAGFPIWILHSLAMV